MYPQCKSFAPPLFERIISNGSEMRGGLYNQSLGTSTSQEVGTELVCWLVGTELVGWLAETEFVG